MPRGRLTLCTHLHFCIAMTGLAYPRLCPQPVTSTGDSGPTDEFSQWDESQERYRRRNLATASVRVRT